MVKPAPVQKRPLEIIYNPYPTSCSKFCNHPIDRDLRQEYKDVIRKAKEGVVSVQNFSIITFETLLDYCIFTFLKFITKYLIKDCQ